MSDFAVVKALLTSLHEYCEGSGPLQAKDVEIVLNYIRKAISCKGMCKQVEQHLVETMVLLSKFHAALMSKVELAIQLKTVLTGFKGNTGTVSVTVPATPRMDTVKFLSLNVALHSRLLAASNEFSVHTIIDDESELELPKENLQLVYTRDQIMKLRQSSFGVPDFPAWSWIAGIVTLNIDTPPNTPTTTSCSFNWKRW